MLPHVAKHIEHAKEIAHAIEVRLEIMACSLLPIRRQEL
jgi:hypothetical protein